MANLNIVTVVQARTTSTRLPRKVLLSVCGKPLLVRMVERVMAAENAGQVIIATSTNPDDDAIEELCKKENIPCFRGHPTDLLDRHYKAALKYNADAVVKIPSDCPLIDPHIIDKVIQHYIDRKEQVDFVSIIVWDGDEFDLRSDDSFDSF